MLAGQEARGRHRAREHMTLLDRDAHVLQAQLDVAARALAIVGQKQKWVLLA